MTTDTRRLPPHVRRNLVLNSAVELAHRDGLHTVTPETVAENCVIETSAATVRYYFTTIEKLLVATIRHANGSLDEQGRELGLTWTG